MSELKENISEMKLKIENMRKMLASIPPKNRAKSENFTKKISYRKTRLTQINEKTFENIPTHMRFKTGENPKIGCTVCPAVFTDKFALGRHMRIHTGENIHSDFGKNAPSQNGGYQNGNSQNGG